MQVIRDFDGKGITIVSEKNGTVYRRASVFLNVCTRSDGGITVWGDGEPAVRTIRTDKTGRVINKRPR